MQELLLKNLYGYIVENNPDLMLSLQDNRQLTAFLEEKIKGIEPLLTQLQDAGRPPHAIEEQCLNVLTEDLRPSRFHYIRAILEEEFEATYYRLKENGTLTYEIINLLDDCNLVFDDFGFSEENEHNRKLHYTITGTISDYLERISE
jgi:hypothetical protein